MQTPRVGVGSVDTPMELCIPLERGDHYRFAESSSQEGLGIESIDNLEGVVKIT